jgi:general secretion pathway protein D
MNWRLVHGGVQRRIAAWQRLLVGLSMLATVAGLVGCTEHLIRRESDTLLRESRYEQALDVLEGGLKQNPDSPLLRSSAVFARNEAFARLIGEAANERAAGRLEEAEALLRRAERFDGGSRAKDLLNQIETERRQRNALAEAQERVAKKEPQAALRIIAEALKANPRQPELVSLQRQLLTEQRRQQVRAAQLGLAETRPISLDFRDANLRTVLDVVTRHSGVNFVLDKDIRSDIRVTVYLRSAPVEDAIDLIASTHQLAKKVIDPRTILVYPNNPEKQREYQEQVVRVFHLASADAKGAAAFLRSMLRLREPFVDERSNMLALRESPENIELAERLIALYDTPDAEVLLELEVLEVRTSRLLDLGVKFPDAVGLSPLGGSGATGLTLNSLRSLNSDRIGVSIGGLLFNLKREVGDFNTLANPRIRVRSREKAKVLIGDKVPVVTATASTGGFVADSVNYLDVGLKLDVEPTVFADDEVAIRVNLEVSSLGREIRTSSGSLAFQISTRSAATLLRLRDGETQLLAGLISSDERSSSSRVPGLGDLPVAGRLFSAQRDESQRTELVLAITPRVLRNIRQPGASEAELWIGTESKPRVRAVGGMVNQSEQPEPTPASTPASTRAGGISAPLGPSAPALAQAGGLTSIPGASLSQPALPSPMPLPAAPPAVSAPAAPAATLRWSGKTEVAPNEAFGVTLEIDSAMAIRGAPMQVRVSGDALQLLDVEEGDFFRSGGSATSFTKAADSASGSVRLGVLRSVATGASGRGALVRLKLRAVKPGVGEVTITAFEPVVPGSAAPPVALPPAHRVTVQ